MPMQCKLCRLHIPDGVRSCAMCGGTVFATAQVEIPTSDPIKPSLLPRSKDDNSPKWLIGVGISLVVAPALWVQSIFAKNIPAQFGDQAQAILNSHSGLSGLDYFEITMKAVLILSALGLNFLFYTKRKAFPKLMVGYLATTLLFLVARISAVNFLFPDVNLGREYAMLLRWLVWAVSLTLYLLLSVQVKERFVR
jgi:Protein of unknown function (DUF2569)